ncbi:cytochrome P450 [Streptosporangium sp. NBC_01756]|uniref:cytochrome P450 n=1 Tax=Streptosporangium sp. NBC_01756 TaxID=2975950 RepID=UPI002DD9F0A7|nr:cytochrome P450 [Streptosporangium sp. NBC_01756]WSC83923.1 cytochrome P450 [Streptosporangium sp. NBC_01756]
MPTANSLQHYSEHEVPEVGPVRPYTLPSGEEGYLVTRYEDARRVLTDPVFSRAATLESGAPRYAPRPSVGVPDSLLDMDAPRHTHLRNIASRAFTRRRIEAMRPGIQQVVDRLLDDLAASGPPSDLVEVLCAPLPITVICQLLGVPYEDRAIFRTWSQAMLSVTDSSETVFEAAKNLRVYMTDLVAAKTTEPGDDLLSTLSSEGEGDALTDSELVNLAVVLLVAGHETTLSQLAASVYALLRRPEMYVALHADPSLVPSAMEELLRVHPTIPQLLFRVTTHDTKVGGVHIPACSGVVISASAANRDSAAFANAHEIKLDRSDNTHVSFGHGPHFCLGAMLARAELQMATAGLVSRFPNLALAVPASEIPWRTGHLVNGPTALPVTW